MDEFVEVYLPALYRFAASRLGSDPELTRDIVQSTLVGALGALDRFRHRSSLFTWLCSCCRNEILMHHRRTRRSPSAVELDDQVEARVSKEVQHGPPEAEARLLMADRREAVHLALDLLPSHYARVLEWKYFDELPVNEIARRLGVRPKAAESLLTRARRAFEGEFEAIEGSAAADRGEEKR